MSEQNKKLESDKIAIVTGGSRGIGRNTVLSLAKREVHAIFTYHTRRVDAKAVVVAVKDAGAKVISLQLDAGNIASFDAFVESVKDAIMDIYREIERLWPPHVYDDRRRRRS